jgi:hypothetical protein
MVEVTGGEESAENDKPNTVTISLVPALTVMAGCKDIVILTPVSDVTDLDKVICIKNLVRLKPDVLKYEADTDVPEDVWSRGPDQKSQEKQHCSACRGAL